MRHRDMLRIKNLLIDSVKATSQAIDVIKEMAENAGDNMHTHPEKHQRDYGHYGVGPELGMQKPQGRARKFKK